MTKKVRKKLKVTHFKVRWYDHELKKIVEYDHTLYYPITVEKLKKHLSTSEKNLTFLELLDYEVVEEIYELGLIDFINYAKKVETKGDNENE